jgi:DNA-binding ferritin-like protein
MNEEANSPQEVGKIRVEEETKEAEESLQELIESLKSVQDDIGQICELASEEENFVTAFLDSLLKIMRPLKATIAVSPSALSGDIGSMLQASVDPTGNLIVLFKDGRMELKDLSDEANRDLLVKVIRDIMPKFKQLTSAYRQKIENRIKFLSAVTKELQKISKAFSTVFAK